MILHRNLLSLLKKLALNEHTPPDPEQWRSLLYQLSDQLRSGDEDRHRLKGSLDVHTREVQSLYRELVKERERLGSALACLTVGFIAFDRDGRLSLMNAEAEIALGWSENDPCDLETLLGYGPDDLASGHHHERVGDLLLRNGETFATRYQLQALFQDGAVNGAVLTFELPTSSPVEAEPVAEPEDASPNEQTPAKTPPRLPSWLEPSTRSEETAPASSEPGPPPPPEPVRPVDPPLRVLLVEDEPVSRLVTQSALEKLGHLVIASDDAKGALLQFQLTHFDTVICGYLQPAFSGVELCQKIRESPMGAGCYFILLTAAEQREEAAPALEAGVDAFLSKPLDPRELELRLMSARALQLRMSRVQSRAR